MFIYLPLLICLVGLLVYVLLSADKKGACTEVGRMMFWVGLLAWLLGGAKT